MSMRSSRRTFLTNSLRVAGGVIIAGCVPQAPVTQATASPAGTVAPSKRGTLTYGASVEVTGLEPFHNTGTVAVQIYNSLYDTLTGRDLSFKLVPKLAESWKLLNDTTWQFKLRPGVKFHNGDPLTAADVKFSIEYTRDPAAKTIFSTTFASVKTIDVVDDVTLNITTDGPDVLLADRVSIRPGFIMPKKYFEQVGYAAFDKKPVGSGPYQFQEAVQGVRLVLAANKSYWGTVPNADTITIIPRPEVAARVAALKAGEVNYIDNLGYDQYDDLARTANTKPVAVPGLGQSMYMLNALVPPLDNKLVRQAMSLSIDRPTLIKTLFLGMLKVANSPLMPMDFAYDPSIPPYPFDPARARALLQQAGYQGQKIIFEYVGANDIDQAVAEGWKAVGLNVELQGIDAATRARKLAQKTFLGVFAATFRSFYADPDGVIWRTMQPGGSLRYWTNAEFDRLGSEAATSVDQEQRRRNYRRMVQIMVDEMPWLTLWEETRLYATGGNAVWRPEGNGLTDDFHAERLLFT
jgi:peptide/nickel transport system substrate-binding protein